MLDNRLPRSRILRAIHLHSLHNYVAEIQMQITEQANSRELDN